MNLSEGQYEVIEAYLNNELSAADRTVFENDMQIDAELRTEVTRQRDIRLGLRAIGIEQALERAKAQYKATVATEEMEKTVSRPLVTWRYWAAAASVVVVLGLGYYTYQQANDQQADIAYAETSTSDELVKDFPSGTLSPDVQAQLLDALTKYKSGKYDQVITQLTTLPADKQTIHYKNYFLGLSYLVNKQPTEAIPLLNKALTAPSLKIRKKAEWFLALAYVKNNQKEKALPILKTISIDNANPFQSQAKQVLQKIE